MINSTIANTPVLKNRTERETVEMEFFVTIHLNGTPRAGRQSTLRDFYRGKINGTYDFLSKTEYNYLCSSVDNPNSAKSSNEEVESDIIRHLSYSIDLKANDSRKSVYKEQIYVLKRQIENELYHYCLLSNVTQIKIYFYVVAHNQSDIITNIVSSFGIYDDDKKLQKELKKLFDFRKFLSNKKIKLKTVYKISSIDSMGAVEGAWNEGFAKFVTSYDKIIVKEGIYNERDFPTEENISIYDAVVMCQHTYNNQTASQKSIFSIIRSLFVKDKPKASSFETKVEIAVDKRIEKNIQDNKFKGSPNVQNVTTRIAEDGTSWISTNAEWQMIGIDRYSDIIKSSKVSLNNNLIGFNSVIYKKIVNDNIISFAYCTAGTDPLSFNDWVFANFLQGLTGISLQHTQSVRNAKKLDKYCSQKNIPLYFIGHSLGGGLASNNALATGSRHAITFNAAGLSLFRVMASLLINNPKDLFKREERKGRIHPFIIDGEAVQFLRYIGQPAMGVEHDRRYLDDVSIEMDDKIIREKKVRVINKLGDLGSIEKHSVENFLRISDITSLTL